MLSVHKNQLDPLGLRALEDYCVRLRGELVSANAPLPAEAFTIEAVREAVLIARNAGLIDEEDNAQGAVLLLYARMVPAPSRASLGAEFAIGLAFSDHRLGAEGKVRFALRGAMDQDPRFVRAIVVDKFANERRYRRPSAAQKDEGTSR